MNVITGTTPHPNSLPYDTEAEITEALPVLEYIQPYAFNQVEFSNHQKLRSRIRYLAALFPDADLNDLTHRIHGLINNQNFDVHDIRLILQGRRLNNPSIVTKEVSLPIIQGIGRCLRDGKSLRSTAKDLRVSYDTVEAIEKFLGIRSSRELRLMDDAVNAVRDGLSIRSFAKVAGISKGKAHRMMLKGHLILREIGEINE
jgi:transposase-like protein